MNGAKTIIMLTTHSGINLSDASRQTKFVRSCGLTRAVTLIVIGQSASAIFWVPSLRGRDSSKTDIDLTGLNGRVVEKPPMYEITGIAKNG